MIKYILFIIFYLLPLLSSAQTFVGFSQSIDFNVYRFYNGVYPENNVKNKFSVGFTTGLLIEHKFNDFIGINIGGAYSKKKYTPERAFRSGPEWHTVKISALEFPLNIRFSSDKFLKRNAIEYYLLLGMVYHIEREETIIFKDSTVHPLALLSNFFIPSLSLGTQYKINEKLYVSGEINIRGGKCHCEYLNRKFDKLALVFSIKRKLF